MSKILVVEDEQAMRMGLKDNLEFEGYHVDTARDGQEGWEKVRQTRYDLMVLDVMLPRMSGFDLCREMRRSGINIPVLMLTAKGEEIDKVLGLELGADDYVTKPFSLRELLARIKALLRRAGDGRVESGFVKLGELEVDFDNYSARRQCKDVHLTHKEYEILRCLWCNRNKTVTRDQLLDEVWGIDEMITTRTIDNFITRLRKQVETHPSKPAHILTVHGMGYKLIV